MGIEIDDLDPTVLQSRAHEVPSMKDGVTVKLTVAQILGLIQKGDFISLFNAGDVVFAPTGAIAAATVQAALAELDSEKLAHAGGVMTGAIQDLLFAPSSAPTKKAQFDNAGITAGQTRTIGIPDRNITLGKTVASKVTLPAAASVDFTGIPAGVRRVCIDLDAISTSGTAGIVIQLGTASGVETTGYTGGFVNTDASGTGAQTGPTTSLRLGNPFAASDVLTGRISLELIDVTNNRWLATGLAAAPAVPRFYSMTGAKSLSAALDRIRLTTSASDTFDAGSASVSWSF